MITAAEARELTAAAKAVTAKTDECIAAMAVIEQAVRDAAAARKMRVLFGSRFFAPEPGSTHKVSLDALSLSGPEIELIVAELKSGDSPFEVNLYTMFNGLNEVSRVYGVEISWEIVVADPRVVVQRKHGFKEGESVYHDGEKFVSTKSFEEMP
jgi:hypothetical protein